jgi:hypothetical protein
MSFSLNTVPSGREGEELRQECYSVRINVFHHEQGFPLEAEIDKLRLISSAAAPHCGQGAQLYGRAFAQTRRDG